MSKRPSFTLIELLVVVAIIAVLIAILLPALQSAREQGLKAVCASHWHQIGIFFEMYQADNNGKMPDVEGKQLFELRAINSWRSGELCGFGRLRPYIPKTGQWQEGHQGWLDWIEGEGNLLKRGPFSDPTGPATAYPNFVNIAYILPVTAEGTVAWWISGSTWPWPSAHPGPPSDVAVGVCDIQTSPNNPFQPIPIIPLAHKYSGANILRLDGHAIWRPAEKFSQLGSSSSDPWYKWKIAFNN